MHENYEELLKSAQTEIFSEKTSRYKRNVLILSVVLAGIHIIGATFLNLNLLGVQLPSDMNSKAVAVSLLWVANVYNIAMLWVHGRRDWKNWVTNLTSRSPDSDKGKTYCFPELKMYWEQAPTLGDTKRYRFGAVKKVSWGVKI